MRYSKSRNRHSEKQIRKILQLQSESDTTVSTFCRTHRIKKATFYNWRNKYGLKDQTPAFVPVELADRRNEDALFAEIALASGITVKLFRQVDASYFKLLLS